MKTISIILPVFNEEENVPLVYGQLKEAIREAKDKYLFEFIFVDDGSSDNSFLVLEKIASLDKDVKIISFSRNFGHQMVLTAGYDHSTGDAIICLDSDLQHPPKIIPLLLEKWEKGKNIVYTIRKENERTPLFKKYTANFFYYLINKISKTRINKNAADYRLMSREALDAFLKLREKDRFIRGMIGWLGFETDYVEYEVCDRAHGKSKYSLLKMLQLATDAITSFSGMPLRLSFIAGMFVALSSFFYGIYLVVASSFFHVQYVSGWASVLVSILFLGGIQLISIGILGEYIYRIFNEIKNRPLYIINKKLNIN